MPRRIKLMGKLASLAAESLEQAGVTWRDLNEIRHDGTKIIIPAPPFYTPLALGGQPLQQFLDVEVGCSLEDFVACYEVFVATYILNQNRAGNPDREVSEDLKLHRRDAAVIFGRAGPGRPSQKMRDRAMMAPGLAALAEYNFGGRIAEDTPTAFVVEVQGEGRTFRFGVKDHAVLTNYSPSGRAETGLNLVHPKSLWRLPRNAGAGVRKPDTLALIWAWVNKESTAKSHPEKASLKLALEILFWRGAARQHSVLASAVREAAGPETWSRALRMAGSFADFEDPYKDLFSIFVPNLLTKREFVKLFGDRPRRGYPNQARRKLWRMTLDYLGTKYAGETP